MCNKENSETQVLGIIGPEYNAIPGTSHLVDVDNTGTSEETKEGIILIPEPNDDIEQPLNWSSGRKLLQVFCLVIYVYGGAIGGCTLYSIFEDVVSTPGINLTLSQLNAGTGYMFLFLGIGGLFFLPLAQKFGKRPIYLISLIGAVVFNVVAPYTKSAGMWYMHRILEGFFLSPAENLPTITIMDLYFEHERATYMAIYGVAVTSSNYIAPLIAGFICEALGWKWAMFIADIFGAMCAVLLYFLMEETNYDVNNRKMTSGSTTNGVVEENSKHENLSEFGKTIDERGAQNCYKPAQTYIQKLSLTGGVKKNVSLRDCFMLPLHMARFPVVWYAGFIYGISVFMYSLLNATESSVLSAPPYNFDYSMCGLAYLSPLICVFIVFPYAGWSTDRIKIIISRRHNGTSQAEDRLWVLSLYTFLAPASLILWGVGASHGIHWIGIIIGLGMMGGLTMVGGISSVVYVLDTYPELNFGAAVIVILLRNVMMFALDYGISPFIEQCGLQNTFIAWALISFGSLSTFLLAEKFGYSWRKASAKRYWDLVSYYRSKGVIN